MLPILRRHTNFSFLFQIQKNFGSWPNFSLVFFQRTICGLKDILTVKWENNACCSFFSNGTYLKISCLLQHYGSVVTPQWKWFRDQDILRLGVFYSWCYILFLFFCRNTCRRQSLRGITNIIQNYVLNINFLDCNSLPWKYSYIHTLVKLYFVFIKPTSQKNVDV